MAHTQAVDPKKQNIMYFNTVTQEQLDALAMPGEKWRLDRLLESSRNPKAAKVTGGFETLDACWAEDRRRARALRQVSDELRTAFGCNAEALAELLERGAEQKIAPNSCASVAYMRGRRLAFLGSLLELIHNNKGLELGFVSVAEREWRFDLHDDVTTLEDNIRSQFRRLLNSVRIWDFPGFMVACVNGQFDVREQKTQFMFNGIYAGEKRRASLIWDNDDQLQPSALSVNESDLPGQICQLIPNCIVEGDLDFVATENRRRMREPYHSLYLMWLAHCSLADRMLLDDVSVKPTGSVMDKAPTYWWAE
jgi:hypothetical protein